MSSGHDIAHLYRVHGHSVLRRAGALLGNEHDAREMVQEIFASLVERPDQFRGESSITTWLYSATTNACLNRIRDGRTRQRLLDERVAPAESEARPPGAEARVIVKDLLARLPGELATAAVYYYVDEMTHDEIASVMGCSRRHVGNLLTRLEARMLEEEAAS